MTEKDYEKKLEKKDTIIFILFGLCSALAVALICVIAVLAIK